MLHKDFVRWLRDILLDYSLKLDEQSLYLIVKLYGRG